MRTICSREIFTKKCRQQQVFDSDLKGAWHYNHLTFTPIAKKFMLYCRLIYMLSILWVRLTTKVKVGIPESFEVGWYSPQKTGSSHLKRQRFFNQVKISTWTIRRTTNCSVVYITYWSDHWRANPSVFFIVGSRRKEGAAVEVPRLSRK